MFVVYECPLPERGRFAPIAIAMPRDSIHQVGPRRLGRDAFIAATLASMWCGAAQGKASGTWAQ